MSGGYETAPPGTARTNLRFWATKYLTIRYPNGPDLYPEAADKQVDAALDALVAEARQEALKPTMWLCHYPGEQHGESFWYDDRDYAIDCVEPGTVYRVERAMRLPDVFVVVRRNVVSDDDEVLEFATEAEATRV